MAVGQEYNKIGT